VNGADYTIATNDGADMEIATTYQLAKHEEDTFMKVCKFFSELFFAYC